MQWDSYRARAYGGRRYGMKSDSFTEFEELPSRAGSVFEIALGSENAPRERLRAKGWRLLDPLEVTRDPWTFQEFIRASKAEWSVAKHGYVASRSGWFSERSAAYLASGRPVLTQATGFSDWLETGAGLLAFDTLEDALAGMAEIDGDYPRPTCGARAGRSSSTRARSPASSSARSVEHGVARRLRGRWVFFQPAFGGRCGPGVCGVE